MNRKIKTLLLLIFCLYIFFSCKTLPKEKENSSVVISDKGVHSQDRLVNFFLNENPQGNKEKVQRLATLYIDECKIENINHDIAFAQMCLETGFLRFGNLVTEDMNNFCGLGAISSEQRGLTFATEQLGVRAHVQHLHAYGSTGHLKNECIDPRYKYVKPRGKAPTIFELAGTWASDKAYGQKLQNLLNKLNQSN
ncbi:MAG: glucosaminidase domain-containing protein [Treponema sp.]|nr:glucosaminidase domain-containing protein [Treponema sp.]